MLLSLLDRAWVSPLLCLQLWSLILPLGSRGSFVKVLVQRVVASSVALMMLLRRKKRISNAQRFIYSYKGKLL